MEPGYFDRARPDKSHIFRSTYGIVHPLTLHEIQSVSVPHHETEYQAFTARHSEEFRCRSRVPAISFTESRVQGAASIVEERAAVAL